MPRVDPPDAAVAEARLATPPSAKGLRVRASRRTSAALPIVLIAIPLGGLLAHFSTPARDRIELFPYGALILVAYLVIVGIVHFSTGHFVIDPKAEQVRYEGETIPFSELSVPRIVTEKSLEVAGEFGELVREADGEVLQVGTHVFFRQGMLPRKKLEKVANALNDAIREHDERESIRTWIERGAD